MQEKKLTGYPSIDKPWLKYYKEGTEERALNTPKDMSFYRFYKENVFVNPDFPVLKYFNAVFSAKQFLETIDMWARAFRAVGVNEDEMVPVYGTWSPEISAVFFALNAIGAHPYFEKLDITEDALRTETAGAKVGVVFEPLWNETAKAVFGEDRFEKVFMVGLADSMRFPLKQLVKIKGRRFRKSVVNLNKYIFKSQVKKLAKSYSGSIEARFKPNRIAIITTSSGTTSSAVKGIIDTNESALANVLGTAYSKPGYIAGKECFVTLPPTASTAINCFFLLPLYKGMTVRIDPRADEKNWTRLLLKYKPSVSINTGSLWYSFYRNISEMLSNGKKVDLSFADSFIMGGSGVTKKQLAFMNSVAEKCSAPHELVSGYGCSEFFGVITVDKYEVKNNSHISNIIDVGIPIPGATIGVFDNDGNEVTYGKRGEIRAKGPSIMHGYFGKPEQTKQLLDGEWLKTGDIGEIDENGYLYVYGRKKDAITVNSKTIYLFDVANALREKFGLEDCMAEVKKLTGNIKSIVIYYVQKSNAEMKDKELINALSKEVGVDEYAKISIGDTKEKNMNTKDCIINCRRIPTITM